MKVDFTSDTFNPDKRFMRVLMQQGRVLRDAEFNELQGILLRYIQTLAEDLIGPHGGAGDAFKIGATSPPKVKDFAISAGHYYVHGILCENPEAHPASYTDQADYPQPLPNNHENHEKETLDPNNSYLVYLDVWERQITSVEDDSIREVALGGPDTAARSRVVWQVKVVQLDLENDKVEVGGEDKKVEELDEIASHSEKLRAYDELLDAELKELGRQNQSKLAARVSPGEKSEDPCVIHPNARYRGLENQLYRVEIHDSGVANQQGSSSGAGTTDEDGTSDGFATFKWSRDNGSIVFPLVEPLQDTANHRVTAKVGHLGQDGSRTLIPGDWVEYVDDYIVERDLAGPLFEVQEVHPLDLSVTLSGPQGPASLPPSHGANHDTHPLLRRWDSAGAVKVTVPNASERGWIPLEDGIEVKFSTEDGDPNFRTGDYWLIPARTITGSIEWPQEGNPPEAQAEAPHGIIHHYAPLARITLDANGNLDADAVVDYRRTFVPLSEQS